MRLRYLVAPLLAFLVMTAPGCAAVVSALPSVIAAVTDAMLILDQIEDFVRRYFAANPDPAREKKFDVAMTRCRSALVAAQRTAKGAEKLDQQKVDEAFAEFKVAYRELAALCATIPGLRVQKPGEKPLTARPGELAVPAPEALTIKAE